MPSASGKTGAMARFARHASHRGLSVVIEFLGNRRIATGTACMGTGIVNAKSPGNHGVF